VLLVEVVFGGVPGVDVVGLTDVVATGAAEPVPLVGFPLDVILQLLWATELATPAIGVGPGTTYEMGEL
jgi:hypothetical protein